MNSVSKTTSKRSYFPVMVFCVFFFSLIFFIYLTLTAQTVVIHDAGDYEKVGQLLSKGTWLQFFKTGLHREPFYPFVIAQSMRIADFFSINYLDVQKGIQLLILWGTQFLVYHFMTRLKINKFIGLLTVFCCGFTPALFDSAVNLFSESILYPLVLILVLLISQAIKATAETKAQTIDIRLIRIPVIGCLLGLIFVISTLTKALFEYVFVFDLLCFVFMITFFCLKKKYIVARNLLLLTASLSLVYFPCIHTYKSLNKAYNGNYAITDRGPFMLYGNTMRALEPFRLQNAASAFLSVLSGGDQAMCYKFLDADSCRYWEFRRADAHAHDDGSAWVQNGLSSTQVDKRYIREAVRNAARSPIQYGLFYFFQALALILFKGAELGFAAYPNWLSATLTWVPLSYGISLASSTLTAFSFIFFLKFLWRNKSMAGEIYETYNDPFSLVIAIGMVLLPFIGLYSLVSVLVRYCLPAVPLYLILTAFWINSRLSK